MLSHSATAPWLQPKATMDGLRVPARAWGDEMKAYEREKRRVVDEGLMQGSQYRLQKGIVQELERVFDPVTQNFRDPSLDARQRAMEEKERIVHLNRARDTQILRSQPFNIVNHTSHLEALVPNQDPMRLGNTTCKERLGETKRQKEGKPPPPSTYTDYNIVSNLPFDDHHWQKPGERPYCKEKEPKLRQVPPFMVKDFNIVTNRYLEDHDRKLKTEKDLNLLEATHKFSTTRQFDPVVQQFNDPRLEERYKVALDAQEVEVGMRFENRIPPTYKKRVSNHYGIISHQAHNPEGLHVWDKLEEERLRGHQKKHNFEWTTLQQDVVLDRQSDERKMNKVAPERFAEQKRRGYDIIDNRAYGKLWKEKTFHEDFGSKFKRMTPWQKTQMARREGGEENGKTIRLDPAYSSPDLHSQSHHHQQHQHQHQQPQQQQQQQQQQRLPSSSSAPALSRAGGPSGASRRSDESTRTRSRRSDGSGRGREAMLGGTIRPPPAPAALPGGGAGPIYSRAG